MRTDNIRVGDVLKLKPGIYDDAYDTVRVAAIRRRSGYKTPWIYAATGEAFRPSDFARHV